VRVVSWNIAFGIEIDAAIRELSANPDLRDADIWLLQEMDGAGTATIADALGVDYAYGGGATHQQTGREFGNAILSRWPVRPLAELPLPGVATVSGHPRAATRAWVSVGGHDVLTYSVHTETAAMRLARRVEQFRTISGNVREYSQQEGNPQVVVGGDFNTVTERGVRALQKTMADAELDRVSHLAGPSFRRAGRRIPLDHIFARGLSAIDAGVDWNATASDHMPMWVELEAP
jgi:endonuclease/exonuclease/phosphatase family metal-dependent hydrolase